MTKNAHLTALLDEGSFLPINTGMENGVIYGLGTVLSRPVSVIALTHSLTKDAPDEMQKLLDRTLSAGVPLLLFFSQQEKLELGVSLTSFLKKLVRISGICPIISYIEGTEGDVASQVLPFSDFCFYADGAHSLALSACQAQDATDAIERIRTLLSFLPLNCAERTPAFSFDSTERYRKRAPMPTSEGIISCIFDSNCYSLYVDNYTHAGFARISGRTVGYITSNNGSLPPQSSRFLQFCDCYSVPLVIISESALSLSPELLYILSRATIPCVSIGCADGCDTLFDYRIGVEGIETVSADRIVPMSEMHAEARHVLELLQVKRDVLPPHKHGNPPLL